ncbi:hypothetical protein GXM_04923 [Nostoc sphaeroides CCNUC1]|uniref:Uncharacterized protein n=1 Tax=Nostoc sphaeroides CCNUC1 TaxID=2653204 RepID=A0A5P8W4K1_9NOSO|nr:hypothetical protein GXM_04923 [Nostoc sphaeroides CCNUC1]
MLDQTVDRFNLLWGNSKQKIPINEFKDKFLVRLLTIKTLEDCKLFCF